MKENQPINDSKTETGNKGVEDIDYEGAIYDLIDQYKDSQEFGELTKMYEERAAKAGTDSEFQLIFNQFKKALVSRKSTFWEFENHEVIFESNLGKELSEKSEKKVRSIIEKARKGALDFVGKGFTAEVFSAENVEGVCIKIVYDISEYKKGVNIGEEAEIQGEAYKLKTENVRPSFPYYSIMNKDYHMMVMEELNALTLKDVIDNPGVLPVDFDVETFSSQLEEYLNKLHSQGIYHRDLHDKNIMVDLNDFTPRVIDFGKALINGPKGESEDKNNFIYRENKGNKEIIYRNDFEYTNSLIKLKNAHKSVQGE